MIFIGVYFVLLHDVNCCNGVGDDAAGQSEENRSAVILWEFISVVWITKLVFKAPIGHIYALKDFNHLFQQKIILICISYKVPSNLQLWLFNW